MQADETAGTFPLSQKSKDIRRSKCCSKYQVETMGLETHMIMTMGKIITYGVFWLSSWQAWASFPPRVCADQCCRTVTLEKQQKKEQEAGGDVRWRAPFLFLLLSKVKKVHPFYLSFIFHLNSVCEHMPSEDSSSFIFFFSIGHKFAFVATAKVFCVGVSFFPPHINVAA